MDLSKVKEVSFDLNVKHPATGEATGLILTLESLQSPAVKRVRNEIEFERVTGKDVDLNEAKTRILIACVAGVRFTGDAAWNGKKPKMTDDLICEIVSRSFIADQIQAALEKSKNFYKA